MSNGYGAGDRGRGMGKGLGRARGRRGGGGGARGQGMGRGRGNGRGLGRGQGYLPLAGSSPPAPEPRDAAQRVQALKAQAQDMMDQFSAITQRIAEIEATRTNASAPMKRQSKTDSHGARMFRRMIAVIDQERCMCCALCVDVCPEQAISMNHTVAIDSSSCTGCGSCVNECPNEAISFRNGAPRRAAILVAMAIGA